MIIIIFRFLRVITTTIIIVKIIIIIKIRYLI